jgi:hypothetical protein
MASTILALAGAANIRKRGRIIPGRGQPAAPTEAGEPPEDLYAISSSANLPPAVIDLYHPP